MQTKNKLTCKQGLKKGVVKKEVFDREVALCQKLAKKNKGKCGWGKCQYCWVVPLLYKLHRGELIEEPEEIKKVKDSILS